MADHLVKGDDMPSVRDRSRKTRAPRTYQPQVPARSDDEYRAAILAVVRRLRGHVQAEAEQVGKPTLVYRFFDAADRLLYVGITSSAVARMCGHAEASDWVADAAYSTFEHWPNRDIAARRERYLIRVEQPLHNQQRARPFADVDELDELHCMLAECEVEFFWPGEEPDGYYDRAIDAYLHRDHAVAEHAHDRRILAGKGLPWC